MTGIINSIVQAATLFALQRLTRDEVTDVNHIAQFAYILSRTDAFEEVFGLLVKEVETLPRPMETQVATHNTHVSRHNLPDLFLVLLDEHYLLVGHRSLVVPGRNLLVEVTIGDDTQT
jgi:hypothetical protein